MNIWKVVSETFEGAGLVGQISSDDKSELCSQKLNIFQIWIKCDNRVLSTRDDSYEVVQDEESS